jgi:hypothetical protein
MAGYPSQFPPLSPSPSLTAILALLEAGPPPCSCDPRIHRCRGECNPDEYCACCEGECRCPIPRAHACYGDCPKLSRKRPEDIVAECPCCSGKCDCPPMPWAALCHHGREWKPEADELWPIYLLLQERPKHRLTKEGKRVHPGNDPYYTDAYQDPPPPTVPILSQKTKTRVKGMRDRVARGEAIFDYKQLYLPAFEELARQAVDRGANGNDVTTLPIGLEREVRRAA